MSLPQPKSIQRKHVVASLVFLIYAGVGGYLLWQSPRVRLLGTWGSFDRHYGMFMARRSFFADGTGRYGSSGRGNSEFHWQVVAVDPSQNFILVRVSYADPLWAPETFKYTPGDSEWEWERRPPWIVELVELGIPLCVALLLGASIGLEAPGQPEHRSRRVVLGMAGGFVGVVFGLFVTLGIVQNPRPVNIGITTVCAALGAVAGARVDRWFARGKEGTGGYEGA